MFIICTYYWEHINSAYNDQLSLKRWLAGRVLEREREREGVREREREWERESESAEKRERENQHGIHLKLSGYQSRSSPFQIHVYS